MALTYSQYLKLDELLSLQRPLSAGPEHDETLFIIIHQVTSSGSRSSCTSRLFAAAAPSPNAPRALHTLKRILTVLKVVVAQIDVLETMTPLEFLSFRDRLQSGSGFQSYSSGARVRAGLEGRPRPRSLSRRLHGAKTPRGAPRRAHALGRVPGLPGARGVSGPDDQLHRDVTRRVEPNPQIQRLLIDVYRTNPMVSQLCERLVDVDEGSRSGAIGT